MNEFWLTCVQMYLADFLANCRCFNLRCCRSISVSSCALRHSCVWLSVRDMLSDSRYRHRPVCHNTNEVKVTAGNDPKIWQAELTFIPI